MGTYELYQVKTNILLKKEMLKLAQLDNQLHQVQIDKQVMSNLTISK